MKSEKIAMARALLNTRAIDAELSTYNLHQLSKSAAVGAYKEERLKVAALIRQSELEKQAFLSAFCNLEKRANRWRAAWNAAKGLGSYAAKKLGPTTKAVQSKVGPGAMAGAMAGARQGFSPGLGGLDGKQSPINWKGGRGFPPQGTGKQSPINWGPDGPAGDLPTHSTGPDGKQSPINWGPAGPAGGLPR
jgi:hypothetical protein